MDIKIRPVESGDISEILNIYAPYVANTAITFEYEVPSFEDFAERVSETVKRYPYLVAEKDGHLVGYAYAGPFHNRPAYKWAVETSIYVDGQCKHMGIGGLLHATLESELRCHGVLNMCACIAYPKTFDEFIQLFNITDKKEIEFLRENL